MILFYKIMGFLWIWKKLNKTKSNRDQLPLETKKKSHKVRLPLRIVEIKKIFFMFWVSRPKKKTNSEYLFWFCSTIQPKATQTNWIGSMISRMVTRNSVRKKEVKISVGWVKMCMFHKKKSQNGRACNETQ